MKIDGKELRITEAGFNDALELHDSIIESLKKEKAELKLNFKEIEDTEDMDFGGIFRMALEAAGSSRVRSCLFKCATKAVYDDQRIDPEFFERVENRKLYYPIMMEILKVNLGPFFGSLTGLFGEVKAMMKEKPRK